LVKSHHALGACEDQSLRDSKKVRAKDTISPQIETSREGKEINDRAEGAGEEEKGKRCCRVATNWKGEEKEKRAVLSLVSNLKTI